MEKYIIINILQGIDNSTKKKIFIITENSRNYDVKK